MTTGSSAPVSSLGGAPGAPLFRNPNDTGLLGLPHEIIMDIVLRVLFGDQPSAVRDVGALAGSCYQLHSICRDDCIRENIFLLCLRQRKVRCQQVDMSRFSGVLPTGGSRLVAYRSVDRPSSPSCRVTVLDTAERNKELCTFDVPALSSTCHVVRNNRLLGHTSQNLAIFSLITGMQTAQLLVEEGRECVAAAPCADGRIAYATVLQRARGGRYQSRLEVWNPETGTNTYKPLTLPERARVCALETHGNIVLSYIQPRKDSTTLEVKIWDLDMQLLYSLSDTEVFACAGVPLRDKSPWISSPCTLCDHKLVVLKCSKSGDDIYVWDYAAGPKNIVQINKGAPPLKFHVASLTPSPCKKWVIVLYRNERLEAQSLEPPYSVVCLREGEKAVKCAAYIPSSKLQQATPCIAVGGRVLFQAYERRSLGLWNPQKPHDLIPTIPLGNRVLLVRAHLRIDSAIRVSGATEGESTVCWPTQNMFPLGGNSLLFGCVPRFSTTMEPTMLMQLPSPQGAVLPLAVLHFDVPPSAVVASHPSGAPCCIQ